MRNLFGTFAAALAICVALPAGSVSAQECTCRIPRTDDFVGKIIDVTGDVRIAEAQNFTRASTDSGLVLGTRIIVGRGSTVVLLGKDRSGEECRISLGENSSLTLTPSDQDICAAVETGQTASFGNVGTVVGIAGGALAIIGGAIILSQEDDGPPVSVQ